MEYFKSSLKNVLGAQQGGGQPSGAETVERLVDRVQTSTLLDDRRDAVRALKALSKKFKLEVGAQAMAALVEVLQTDRSDTETVGYAVDTLVNVVSQETGDEEETTESAADAGALADQFTEIFIKNCDNVSLVLDLLDEYDFHVRWPTVKLMTALLSNRVKDIQEQILTNPMGVSKLMDLLSDSREVIRNDTLLLLQKLTKGHANIQKIVAFENAFDRLLQIVSEEGNSDGGIVVEDCLLLLLNLLKNNSSNQNFFKEGSFIQRLTPYFQLEGEDSKAGWSAQKVTNVHLMLQVVRTLVSPNNPPQITTTCQKVMSTCGLMEQLCAILMASGVPADILTETINTVSEVIRGNHVNQEHFASVMAPSNPPRPAIVVLLMSMVNEKQPFILRCAVLYCFQSFLYKNELGQAQIVQTLLPQTSDITTITAGQLLCGGMFSHDALSNWFSAVALSHALTENPTQKEQLLRVQLATSLGNPPVSLLQQCTNMLAQGGKLQTRLGLLMLLCTWMVGCPIAVTHLLHNPANVPFLTSQISSVGDDENEQLVHGLCAFLLGLCVQYNDESVADFTKESLRHIIANRIGLETYMEKQDCLTKNESYARAAQRPQLKYRQASDVLLDYEFTRLFKAQESIVVRAVQGVEDGSQVNGGDARQQSVSPVDDSVVARYKDVIREQDVKLTAVRSEKEEVASQLKRAAADIDSLRLSVQQLKDQNALLKAQKELQAADAATTPPDLTTLHQQLEDARRVQETQRTELADATAAMQTLTIELESMRAQPPTSAAADDAAAETDNLRREVGRLQEELNRLRADAADAADVQSQNAELRSQLSKLRENLESSANVEGSTDSDKAILAEKATLESSIADLQEKLRASEERCGAQAEEARRLGEERNSLQDRMRKANEDKLALESRLQKLEEEKAAAGEETEVARQDAEAIKKEQDDLLILLSDQDSKLERYRDRLKQLGEKVEDDDDDDDDEDEDEEAEEGPSGAHED